MIVSLEDLDLIRYNWSNDRGYLMRRVQVRGKSIKIYLHRVVLERKLGIVLTSKNKVDHKNRYKADCRRSNLRLATKSQNGGNASIRRNKSVPYKGVWYYKPSGKFAARIVKDRRPIFMGYYKTAEEAARVYDKKAIELFGEFAATNVVLGLLPAGKPTEDSHSGGGAGPSASTGSATGLPEQL